MRWYYYHSFDLQVQLQPCPGSSWTDTSVMMWNDITFSPPAITSSILITVLSVYSSLNNGIVEVEFYTAPGESTDVTPFPSGQRLRRSRLPHMPLHSGVIVAKFCLPL